MTFSPPAKKIQLILNDYNRVSMDYLPYAFFCQTKTSVLAVTHASENPVDTIRLNAYDGSKMLKKVISSKKCRDFILFALKIFQNCFGTDIHCNRKKS